MWRRRPVLAAMAVLLAVAALAPAAAGAAPAQARQLTIGRLRLQPCADVEGAWCGCGCAGCGS
jgi:hypothetical protein